MRLLKTVEFDGGWVRMNVVHLFGTVQNAVKTKLTADRESNWREIFDWEKISLGNGKETTRLARRGTKTSYEILLEIIKSYF